MHALLIVMTTDVSINSCKLTVAKSELMQLLIVAMLGVSSI